MSEPIKFDGRSAPLFKRQKFKRGIRPPFKMPGGKYYLAPIFANKRIAPRSAQTWFTGCGGAASEFFCWDTANRRVVYNEADPIKYAVFLCIQRNTAALLERLRTIQYTEDEFINAKIAIEALDSFASEVTSEEFFKTFTGPTSTPAELVGIAAARIVYSRFSVNGQGEHFAWSERTRGGLPGDANSWKTFIEEEFKHIAKRVQPWILLNLDVCEATERVIRAERAEGRTVFGYFDPPYVRETVGGDFYGRWGMTKEKHVQILETLGGITLDNEGVEFAISGYYSELYERYLVHRYGFNRNEIDIASQMSMADSKKRKTEIVWTSYPVP